MLPSREYLTFGQAEPLAERLPLRAGPVSLIFESGDLREIKLGDREIIRRIYGAIRDRDWNTIPGVVHICERVIEPESFRLRYTCEHRQGDIQFVWTGSLSGHPDGTIRFEFDGAAESTFFRNRIGLCTLHPIHECAGAACRVRHLDGTSSNVRFPELVAAEQPVIGMRDLAGIAYEVGSGGLAEITFEGEEFETEDQRNWIDASFKTYSTGIWRPFPVEVPVGTRVWQAVTLRLTGVIRGATHAASSAKAAPELRVESMVQGRLPLIGLSVSSERRVPTEREIQRLRILKLNHLRVDVRLGRTDWRETLDWQLEEVRALDQDIELVVHLPPNGSGEISELAPRLRRVRARIARALALRDGRKSTGINDIRIVRAALAEFDAPTGAGTNGDLYLLNLQRPPPACSFISWSMNPQVHARDLTSLMETPEAAGHQVRSVRHYYPGKRLLISPVTFRPRLNGAPVSNEPPAPANELPSDVDPRQISLAGAGWTLAMIQSLAAAGADSVTFFETVGWRGVMECAAGSLLPDNFPSYPTGVYPLWHVLADLAETAVAEIIETTGYDPGKMACMAFRRYSSGTLLLANLLREEVSFGLSGVRAVRGIRVMSADNVSGWMTEPERHRTAPLYPLSSPPHRIVLPPFAYARLEFEFRSE